MHNLHSRIVFRFGMLAFALVALMTMAQALSAAPPDTGLFVDTTKTGVSVRALDATIVRARYVDLRLNLFDGSIAPAQSKVAQTAVKTLTLNLFPDVTLTATLDKARLRPNGLVWTGRVNGVAGSRVVFTLNKGALIGSIVTPTATYQVRYAGNNVHQVTQLNPKKFPADKKTLAVDKSKLATTQAAQNKDDGTQIEVLVLYTPAAREAAMGADSIRALILAAGEEANLAWSDSQINPRVNLLDPLEIAYNESGDFDTDLLRLQNPSDGFMDDAATWRNKSGADVVTLVIEGAQYCGVAFDIMNPVSSAFAPYGFDIVARSCLIGNWTFVHELAHLMSARHDWATDPTDNAPFTYNHGYIVPSKTARTIMAYPDSCTVDCPRIGFFSNPDLTFSGEALGVPEGQPNAADNRKTLNNTAFTVANFRQHVTSVPAPLPPLLVAPLGNTTNRQPMFTWNVSQNATAYLLWVDGPNGNVIKQWYDAAQVCSGATCNIAAPAALDNGAYTWFVKAWNSSGDSGWATPLGFTINGTPDVPTLISPAGQVTSPVTFKWYAATNATEYKLTVGANVTTVPSGNCIQSTCTSSAVLNPGDYPWSVQACNAAGCSAASATLTITITEDKPIPVSPTGTITQNPPTFVWTPVKSANAYTLWVKSTTTAFENTWYLQLNSTLCPTGANCAFTPSSPLPDGEYAWKVRACNGSTCGTWSAELKFTLGSPTCNITLVEPVNVLSTNKPTFKWTYTGGCQYFYVWVSGPRSDSKWLTKDPQGCLNNTCSWTPDWTYPNGKYAWYVYGSPINRWFGPLNFEITTSPPNPGDFVAPPWTPWKYTTGVWYPIGSPGAEWYYTQGVPGAFSSAYYDLGEYTNLDYQVTLWRFGCASCSHGIDVRGVPGSPDGGWLNAYQFQINRNGYLSVWRGMNDQWVALQNWVYSPAIRTGDNWNTLRVLALNSTLYYYINNTLVWSGSDATLTKGKVGAFIARTNSTTPSDAFFLATAKLTVPAMTTMALPDVSADQKTRNDDANKTKQGTRGEGPK